MVRSYSLKGNRPTHMLSVLDMFDGSRIVFKIITAATIFVKLVWPDVLLQ